MPLEKSLDHDRPSAEVNDNAERGSVDKDSLSGKLSCETSGIVGERQQAVGESGKDLSTRAKLCDCGKPAVLKIVGPRSENRGLRYLCCDRFVFFGKKRNYCRFFEWVDCPRVSKEERKEASAKKHRKLNADTCSLSRQPAVITRSVVKQLGTQCNLIQGVQLHTQKVEFGTNLTNVHPETVTTERSMNLLDSRETIRQLSANSQPDQDPNSQKCLSRDYNGAVTDLESNVQKCLSSERGKTWVHEAVNLEIARIYNKHTPALTDAVRQCEGFVQDLRRLEMGTHTLDFEHSANAAPLNVKDAPARDDLTSTQIAADQGFNEVPNVKEFGEDLEVKNDSMTGGSFEDSEVPSCLCSREAILKTVKSEGPNKGKRFWVCSNSRPFYVKKKKHKLDGNEKSCKFFRWIETPLVKSEMQKQEEKQKKRELQKQRELALLA